MATYFISCIIIEYNWALCYYYTCIKTTFKFSQTFPWPATDSKFYNQFIWKQKWFNRSEWISEACIKTNLLSGVGSWKMFAVSWSAVLRRSYSRCIIVSPAGKLLPFLSNCISAENCSLVRKLSCSVKIQVA